MKRPDAEVGGDQPRRGIADERGKEGGEVVSTAPDETNG
jgi:hypothetical protein